MTAMGKRGTDTGKGHKQATNAENGQLIGMH